MIYGCATGIYLQVKSLEPTQGELLCHLISRRMTITTITRCWRITCLLSDSHCAHYVPDNTSFDLHWAEALASREMRKPHSRGGRQPFLPLSVNRGSSSNEIRGQSSPWVSSARFCLQKEDRKGSGIKKKKTCREAGSSPFTQRVRTIQPFPGPGGAAQAQLQLGKQEQIKDIGRDAGRSLWLIPGVSHLPNLTLFKRPIYLRD